MSPALLFVLLVACLLALIPVWRLHVAGWSAGSLFTAWVLYAVGILVAVRFPAPVRFLLPILILAYVAPFVAGPERLSRVLGGRQRRQPTIINVTPRPAPGLPEPPQNVTPERDDAPGGNGDAPGGNGEMPGGGDGPPVANGAAPAGQAGDPR